ncbi:hypothetical protein [Mycobacterium sp. D16Q16]|uniref:hypothetical protein n=1 Tax=Mycobacterium sp. D16Q16 TaxID=1855659 RepID=UPI000993BEFC|nr:hypothetical protein [Mycobacterium sp. D16Q16]
MNSARNEILIDGLDDWVEFYRVHWLVKQANPDAALGDIQIEALDTVRDLVSAGLYEIGKVERGVGFVPSTISLDGGIEEIRSQYVDHYGEEGTWDYCAWLNLTDQGKRIAEFLLSKA